MPMAERSATTGWDGDLAHGNGVVNGASGALNDLLGPTRTREASGQ